MAGREEETPYNSIVSLTTLLVDALLVSFKFLVISVIL